MLFGPGNVDYAAVQRGKIMETLDKKSDQLNQTADNQKQRADERSDKKREQAQQEAAPSLQKAGKAAAEAALFRVDSSWRLVFTASAKRARKCNEFTVDDWKDIGIDTAKAAAEGGISGFAIYSITNFTSISAGPAAAGVSLAFSVSELAYRKSTGAISDEEFKESCQMAALNAAVSAVGAAIGQELIPIPLLGAWIGSFIATQGLERLCDEGFHNALTMSAYEVRKMTQRLEYGTARIAYSSAYTNQAISQAQNLHEETQTLLDDFNRKKKVIFMTKEQCSLQSNYYGSSCDFQDLQSAVQQLTTKSDAQFEELKNEKWFHRIFNMVVCPRKNNIRMAEQITSLAQAQGILIEILVRLADQDANIAGMVMQSQSDIRALAQNSAYLQERLYLLEDKSYGIKENENLKDLNSQQRNILSGCLNEASKLYAMPSNEQRLYANELLNYLNADAQVANLEDALDDLEDNAKRKILSCVITYMYLYDHTAESMEQDEQEDFIDLFDLGRKTIKSLKQQTVDTYRLRGVDGCIDRYITAPIEITEETPFEVELPEQKTAEGASEAQTEENGEEAIDTNAPREKLVLSGSIQNNGETVYKNKEYSLLSGYYEL